MPQIRILNYTTDSEVTFINKKLKIVKNRLTEEEDQSQTEPENIPHWYDPQKVQNQASQKLDIKSHKLLIVFRATNCQGDKDSQLYQATWANNIHMVSFVPQDCACSSNTIIRVPLYQLNSLYIIKYIQDNYLDKFSWFLIIQNATYVHLNYLKHFIEDLEADGHGVELHYFGKPTHFITRTRNHYRLQIEDLYCSESAGILINHQLVHSLSTNINTCISEYQNSNFVKNAEKFGLCVIKQLNIDCSGVPINTEVSHYHSTKS